MNEIARMRTAIREHVAAGLAGLQPLTLVARRRLSR